MILIIGGDGQGKLDYAKKNDLNLRIFDITSDSSCDIKTANTVNKLNFYILELINAGKSDNEIKKEVLALDADILICDEIGCAVISMSSVERRYIELVGRICCELAIKATDVIRIYCGIPQILKGNL